MTAHQKFERILQEGKCIGCGLCVSMFPDKLEMTIASSGYLRPAATARLESRETDAIYEVCPGVVHCGLPDRLLDPQTTIDDVWGPWRRMERVHARDPSVRHKGATGGALTALAMFMLETGVVESILHVTQDSKHPALGRAHLSGTSEDARAAAGSCYAPAAPLTELGRMLDRGVKFAVIAKPCDISAVRLVGEKDPRVRELITHCLAVVCGGFMPPFAMNAFLGRLGVPPDDVKAVSYRGNGCPGPMRIELRSGKVIERTYLEFWGADSSMWHLPWRCKVCPDGSGEAADLAAADTWPGGSPTAEMLKKDKGSNVVIARTAAGAKLLSDAVGAGYLVSEGLASVENLNEWQPHHARKKIACEARYEGMRREGQLGIRTVGLRHRRCARG